MSSPAQGTVLVTGASGFIGRALLPRLVAHGWQVRAAARNLVSVPQMRCVEPVWLPDMASAADWTPLLSGVSCVVHLAGIAHSRKPIPEAVYQQVNAQAAGDLAGAARAEGLRRFVLMSSVRAQSGPSARGWLTEQSEPKPTDAYGRSKLAAEVAVRTGFGEGATVLRPVLVLGPGVKGNLAALGRLAAVPVPLPFGGLTNRRSLLGIENLISAVEFALSAPQAAGRVFLAADPEPMTVAELLSAMRKAAGCRPGLFPVPTAGLKFGLMATGRGALAESLLGELVADVSALRAAGWKPVSSTVAEIARMMTPGADLPYQVTPY